MDYCYRDCVNQCVNTRIYNCGRVNNNTCNNDCDTRCSRNTACGCKDNNNSVDQTNDNCYR